MAVYVGIDGGGTKTDVVAIDVVNGTCARRLGPPSNPKSVGREASLATMMQLVTETVGDLIPHTTEAASAVEGVCVAVAGIDRPAEVASTKAAWLERYPHAAIHVVNDALAALTAGTKGEPGVVLIAGTGSIAVGELSDGTSVRAGGYGYLVGDEGSGFHIGRQGIRAALQAVEGRGPDSILWSALCSHFDIGHPQEVIAKVYGAGHPVGAVASFARVVLRHAEVDPVANQIIDDAIAQHGRLVEAATAMLAKHAGADTVSTFPIVLAGGLYGEGTGMREWLQHRLPERRLVRAEHSAAAGAALRAMLATGSPSLPNELQSRRDLWESSLQGLPNA